MCTSEMHFRAPDAEVGVVSANWAKKSIFVGFIVQQSSWKCPEKISVDFFFN